MPLYDHFKPPIFDDCGWETFHSRWATMMSLRLSERLPRDYVAREFTRYGTQIEVDVATMQKSAWGIALSSRHERDDGGGVALAIEPTTETYAPPEPELSDVVNIASPDLYEIQIWHRGAEKKLVAAVELVSPRNKDRDESRREFAIKCASYLAAGVNVVVVDTITPRSADSHSQLVDLLDLPASLHWTSPTKLSAVAYRIIERKKKIQLDVWPVPLEIGKELPTLPLWLTPGIAVPLDLESSYMASVDGLRLLV